MGNQEPASQPPPDAREAEDGRLLGDFRLLRPLGKGAMAEVWLAEQTSLKRNVAIKLLRPDLMEDGTYIKRFETEAKAAAGLNHPNIVQVYTTGRDQNQLFIAQEYVQGQTLRAFLQRRGPLDMPLALHIMRQVAAALQAAGERGIVHRDIKPENIMMTRKGEIKVADFGLAQLIQGGEQLNLTQEGTTMGTPLYMSPEQVQGRKVDSRSDIYSFGITCYHMLTGQPPFRGDSAMAVAVMHLNEQATPLPSIRPDLPKAVCDVVERMMAKQPDDRYPGAAELLGDVRKLIKTLKQSGKMDDVTVAEFAAAPAAPSGWSGRHPLPAMCLLLLLVAGSSAGLGAWLRPGLPQPDSRLRRLDVAQRGSAEDQYLHALFLGDDEDAWLAVQEYWPDSPLWAARADEQLALLYLRDRDRWNDAEQRLKALEARRGEHESYFAKARAGMVALRTYQGQHGQARALYQSSQSAFEEHLGPSWRRLVEDARRQIDQNLNPAPSAILP